MSLFSDDAMELQALRSGWKEKQATIDRQAAQIEVMLEAKIDAERYRWLRNALTDRSGNGVSHHFCSISSGHPEELDDSIDAAIAATPKGEVK